MSSRAHNVTTVISAGKAAGKSIGSLVTTSSDSKVSNNEMLFVFLSMTALVQTTVQTCLVHLIRASLRYVLESVTLADVATGELPLQVKELASDPSVWLPH